MTGKRVIAIVAAIVTVAATVGLGWWYLGSDEGTISVTAQFDSASGLYEGNVVAVLGMPVGKITKITAKGGYVEVQFTVTDSGDVSDAKITEANGTQRQASDTLSATRAARFRPEFVNGEPVATTGMTNREVFRSRKDGVDGGR